MKEWYLSTELAALRTMPNSRQAISVKAIRNNWLKRKAAGKGSAVEYHISSFHEDSQIELIELYGDDEITCNIKKAMADFNQSALEFEMKEEQASQNKSPLHKLRKAFSSSEASIHEVSTTSDDSEVINIPEFNVSAAAGAGCLTNAEYQVGVFTVSKELIKSLSLEPRYTAIVFCFGESMLPTMDDGDRILVDTRELTEPVKDGIYVIRIDEMVYVKRLKWDILNKSYHIISDNKEYLGFEIKGKDLSRLKIIGRAAMVMRSL
ncbi:helix-turn-helix domain-containing protein [Vibrio coralliilyticus]|uniref:helix-turn-helix domain-containing protein n=1 Tax=Vibrio coralliilyticus TaxID=190893 RepID=UPI00148DB712|nr:S24 family peptidase [Vibrio coralliilyticus]NOI31898.1 peptidase [Vibrio coralliilyticus]NOI51220.1 peptidase [Vibrio coralliilyticus]